MIVKVSCHGNRCMLYYVHDLMTFCSLVDEVDIFTLISFNVENDKTDFLCRRKIFHVHVHNSDVIVLGYFSALSSNDV